MESLKSLYCLRHTTNWLATAAPYFIRYCVAQWQQAISMQHAAANSIDIDNISNHLLHRRLTHHTTPQHTLNAYSPA